MAWRAPLMASGCPAGAPGHGFGDVADPLRLDDAGDRGAIERRMGVVHPERARQVCEPAATACMGPKLAHPGAQAIPRERVSQCDTQCRRPNWRRISGRQSVMGDTNRIILALKRALRSRGITYAMLAKRISLSEPSVKRILSRGSLSLPRLERICEATGISLEELMRPVSVGAGGDLQHADRGAGNRAGRGSAVVSLLLPADQRAHAARSGGASSAPTRSSCAAGW